jgi:NAD(P)-dependent dehydrogenase (short-subunit alcohol dehydrogenase family)
LTKELLIFGANSPLGKGITGVLSGEDYEKIYLFARKRESIEIKAPAVEVIEINDLGNEDSIISAFGKITPSKNKLFFMFSAVGSFTGGKSIIETEVNELDRMINSNIKANFIIAKYFSELVRNSAGGSACFTSAITGIYPEYGKGIYGLSKAALIHMVHTLALEGEKINLTVNAIAPYVFDTPGNREWLSKDYLDTALKTTEIGEVVSNLFKNFRFMNNNIIELKRKIDV